MADELASILNEDFAEYEEIRKKEAGERGKVKREQPEEGISVMPDENSNVISRLGQQIKVRYNEVKGSLFGSDSQGDLPAGAKGNCFDAEATTHIGPLEPKYELAEENDAIDAQKRARRRVAAGGGFKILFEALNHNIFIARVDQSTKTIIVNIDAAVMKVHLNNCGGNEMIPTFKMFAYSAAIDEYARTVVKIKADNHEFSGTVPEEVLQEGVVELNQIKKRVLDRLAGTLSGDFVLDEKPSLVSSTSQN